LTTRPQRESCINKRLLCPSLASTLRNPILPKAVSKRKYVGLDEPNFDEDADKKRPNSGQEYDPAGDYIYDARKYFNADKYRELIAHQEEKKKKQQQQTQNKFYYRAFHRHTRDYFHFHRYNAVNHVDVVRQQLSLSPSSLQSSEYCVYDADKLQNIDRRSSSRRKKAKKKTQRHRKRHSLASETRDKSVDRKNSDSKKHKKKKKRKRKKAGETCNLSVAEDHGSSNRKHRGKLRHRSRHKSKLHLSREPSSGTTNCDNSYRISYLHQNCAGNDSSRSDLSHLSDDRIVGSNYHQRPYEGFGTFSDCDDSKEYLSYDAEQHDHDVDDMWEEDSSVSSDVNNTNDESN